MRIFLILITGALMAWEAGEAYAGFYHSFTWRGYAMAGLAEIFLAICLAIRLPENPLLRFSFRGLGVLLFVVVVAGAAARDARQVWVGINQAQARQASEEALNKALANSDKALILVAGQRTNTVLQLKRRAELEDRLITIQNQTTNSAIEWGTLILVLLLRFGVQAGNALLAHNLSLDGLKSKNKELKVNPASAIAILRKQGKSQVKQIIAKVN